LTSNSSSVSESTSVTCSASAREVRTLRMPAPVISTFLTPKVLVPNRGGDSGVHRLRMCSVRKEAIFETGRSQVQAVVVHEWYLPKAT